MRRVEQYSLTGQTITAGGAGYTEEILFSNSSNPNAGKLELINENGECTLVMGLTAASGTPQLTIKGKNVYGKSGSSGALTEEDYWTIGTITLSTSEKVFSKMLHIANVDNYDPNADGIQIHFDAHGSINVTLNSGRIKRA